jgi:hypothetical protein
MVPVLLTNQAGIVSSISNPFNAIDDLKSDLKIDLKSAISAAAAVVMSHTQFQVVALALSRPGRHHLSWVPPS